MDKKKQKTDKLLSKVYQTFEDDCKGQDMKFLDCVLDFVNRRSSFLALPGNSNKVIQLIHNHINVAKKQELQNQSLDDKKTSGITKNTKKAVTGKAAKKLDDLEKTKQKNQMDKKLKVSKTAPKIEQNKEEENKMDVDKNEDEESDEEPPPLGNGGKTDKYVWTQTLSEVEVSMDIDANLRGKHLKIVIKKNKLFVAIKGKESEPIIDGKLHDDVNVDDSTWTLDQTYGKDTKTLTVILSKMKGMNWWNRVIVGDPTIDTSKIQPENSKLDSLDDDTRQTVEKMMFDQRQKMKGLPTSKEREQAAILEKFKAQHPEMDFR